MTMEEAMELANSVFDEIISFQLVDDTIFNNFFHFISFLHLQVGKRISQHAMRKLLDRIAMMISYEAYVRGSMDNICTMVISLQDYFVCFDSI